MKTKLTIGLLAGLCALALGAQAQDAGGPPDGGPDGQGGPGGGHRHRPIPPIVQALDANHDGIIDSNEIANASAELKTLDKNGDGQLTMDELMGPRPHHPPGGQDADGQGTNEPAGPPGADQEGGPGGQGGPGGSGHHPPMLPLIKALDANHDGVIDADEIANAPAALKTLDKNGDGQLTRDEYLPPRPHRGPGGQDGPPGGGDQGGNDGPPGPPPGQ